MPKYIYNYRFTGHQEHVPKYLKTLPHEFDAALPSKVDLSSKIPSILDQGNLGSCTCNAMANMIRVVEEKEKINPILPSRLWLYYFGRLDAHEPLDQDTGLTISGLCASVAKHHFCPESDWPYDIQKFAVKPSAQAQKDALLHKKFIYVSIGQNLPEMKTCLASGYTIQIGIQVYDSFESDKVAKTGIVPLPDTQKENLLGGHSVLVVGYDNSTQMFKVLNSWGPDWGLKGYCEIPYKYLLDSNLAGDYHSLRLVS